jgi:hypothetical protein
MQLTAVSQCVPYFSRCGRWDLKGCRTRRTECDEDEQPLDGLLEWFGSIRCVLVRPTVGILTHSCPSGVYWQTHGRYTDTQLDSSFAPWNHQTCSTGSLVLPVVLQFRYVVLLLCWLVHLVIHVTIIFVDWCLWCSLIRSGRQPVSCSASSLLQVSSNVFRSVFTSVGLLPRTKTKTPLFAGDWATSFCCGTFQHLCCSVKADWWRGTHRLMCVKVVVVKVKVLHWFSFRFLRRRRIIRHLLIPNVPIMTWLCRRESLGNDGNAGNSSSSVPRIFSGGGSTN